MQISLVVLLIGAGALATLWLRSPDGGQTPNRQALGVEAAAANKTSGFTLSASPANLNIPAGTQGSFSVTITRSNGFTDSVSFDPKVVTGLPPNSTAIFAPTSTTGNSTTLYISTSPDTKQGSYNPVITGTSTKDSTVTANTTVHVTVSAGQAKQFTISGTPKPLVIGIPQDLDLALTNPNNQPITVSGLRVTIAQVSDSRCSATNNFSIRQFSGTVPVPVPANSTRTLSQLGVTALPQIELTDLPTISQDVCKGVTLTLTYSGTGTGN